MTYIFGFEINQKKTWDVSFCFALLFVVFNLEKYFSKSANFELILSPTNGRDVCKQCTRWATQQQPPLAWSTLYLQCYSGLEGLDFT